MLLAGVAHAETTLELDSRVERALATSWRALDHGTWQQRRTTFFPAAWPPDGRLVVYAYAARTGDVSDGERIARPFAKATVALDGTIAIEPIASALVELGIQGFWPVLRTDIDRQLALGDRLLAALRTARKTGDVERGLVHDYYGRWRGWNGQIATVLDPMHGAFFAYAGALPVAVKPAAYGTARPNGGAPVPRNTLPLGIEHWIGPETLYASAAGRGVVPWRVVAQLSTGVVRAGHGARPGRLDPDALNEWTIQVDDKTRDELRQLAALAQRARATDGEEKILIIGCEAGAYYLQGTMPPAAERLLRRLEALGKR